MKSFKIVGSHAIQQINTDQPFNNALPFILTYFLNINLKYLSVTSAPLSTLCVILPHIEAFVLSVFCFF